MAESAPARLLTDGPAATAAAGGVLARRLEPGDLVLLTGEVGTGKTTWVRGACRALGVAGRVTSPTFTIGRRYPSPPARLPVSHLDLHRLGGLADEDPGLLAEYLTPDSVAFVEWGELGAGELPAPAYRVSFAHAGGDRREIILA